MVASELETARLERTTKNEGLESDDPCFPTNWVDWRMTLEPANICSQLLTLKLVGHAALATLGSHRIPSSGPAEKRQPGDGSQRIAIYRCDCANHDRKVFLSVQKHSFLETSIWTWIIRS